MISQRQHVGKKNGKTRVTLMAWNNYKTGTTTYYYADELPCEVKLYTVLSVIGSIIATPLILLCCIPNLKSIKRVRTVADQFILSSPETYFKACDLLAHILETMQIFRKCIDVQYYVLGPAQTIP
jgi:hypothetical protein